MTIDMIQYIYIISAICFIISMHSFFSAERSKIGNALSIFGMTLSIFATLNYDLHHKMLIIVTIVSAGFIGFLISYRIQMTSVPQLVVGFHSFVGIAAVLISYATLLSSPHFDVDAISRISRAHLLEMSIGSAIGAITFTGSMVAFAKLQDIIKPTPITFYAQQYISVIITIIMLYFIVRFIGHQSYLAFNIAVFCALLLGILLIAPVGGADMPIVISMLNAYSGIATSGIGFIWNNNLLIIVGALIASSGAILSYIMCKAMNRSVVNVIFGAFLSHKTHNNVAKMVKTPNVSSPEDAAHILKNLSSVIIVPGYGVATSQAQHLLSELSEILEKDGISVKFAIHPVAGRMPGHMNVLLAEANIEYDKILEFDEINRDFKITDAVIVVGANDITNPAASNDPSSPIYGMRVFDVANAHTVFFIKRSMNTGYAGIENELFYNKNTFMIFGDAKKVMSDIIKSLEDNKADRN